MIMALAACEENGGKEALDPVLNLSEKVIQATADGGVYELACSIDNPVEGAVLDLAPDSEWISAWEFTGEKLSVTVDPNYDNADRNAVIAVTYTYGEGLVLEDQISVHQVYQYDYNLEAKFLDAGGYFTGRSGNEPDWCFYLSDLGMNADGDMQANATYYRLDICAGVAPEDYTDIFLPEGTYSLSANTMYPGYIDASSGYAFGTYAQYLPGPGYAVLALISDGTLEVAEDADGIYTIDINLKTAEGFTLSGRYVGEIEIPNIPGSGFSTLTGDYYVDLSEATEFTTFNGDGMFSIQLTGPFLRSGNL